MVASAYTPPFEPYESTPSYVGAKCVGDGLARPSPNLKPCVGEIADEVGDGGSTTPFDDASDEVAPKFEGVEDHRPRLAPRCDNPQP